MTPRRFQALKDAASDAFEPLVGIAAISVMHVFGLAGVVPLWWVNTPLLALAVVQQRTVQRWLAGGDLTGRLALRLVLQFGGTAWVVYAIGWGPLLILAFAVFIAGFMRVSGARAWRPALLCTVVFVVAGQAGIALGWIYCYLPGLHAQAAGVFGTIAVALFVRAFGHLAEQHEQAEAAVRSREERFRALVQDSFDVVAVADHLGRSQYVSPAVREMFGVSPEEFVGTSYARWVHPDDLPIAAELLARVAADPGGQHRGELRIGHVNGWRWAEVTVRNLLTNPAVGGVVAHFRDVTERRLMQDRLTYDANHDPLTGLANRALFLRELDRCVADVRSGDRAMAVLFIDLDGFKKINDTLGHRSGDGLIAAVAAMLRASVLGSDIVGRLGGDEFGVLLTGIRTSADALTVAKRILAEMNRPVSLDGQEVHARASIGIAVSGPDRTTAADLLHRADLAMYQAKRRNTHDFHLYVDELTGLTPDMARAH